jgi:hypothetical protein
MKSIVYLLSFLVVGSLMTLNAAPIGGLNNYRKNKKNRLSGNNYGKKKKTPLKKKTVPSPAASGSDHSENGPDSDPSA